jgi:hypothetical protein
MELRVPHTMVLSRSVRPFAFGQVTGSERRWLRTAPRTPEPGLYPTVRGWTDPFKLLSETPGNERIASVLVQDEVPAQFSGALMTAREGPPIIEGVPGAGDQLMLGQSRATSIPNRLSSILDELHARCKETLGEIRLEWAFDGDHLWVLQLQQEAALSSGNIVVPGEFHTELAFDVRQGLAALRLLVRELEGGSTGICLLGGVGMTSHAADILRRHKIPSRISD